MSNVAAGAALGSAISPGLGTIIGAGIGGISNVLGSIFGSKSQQRANDTNLQIARETNQANKDILKEQQQFAFDMWNKENAYNSLVSQVERAKLAHLNPSALFGNGSSTPAGQIGLPSSPQMQGATMQAYNPAQSFSEAGRLVEQGVNSYFQNRLINSQVRKTEAESETIGSLRPHQIEQLKALAKREDWLGEIAKTDLYYYQAIQGQRISQAFNDTRMQELTQKQIIEQTSSVQLQNKLYQVQLAYAPKLNEAQLRQYRATVDQIRADIGLTIARTDLTRQEKENLITENLGKIVDNGLKGLDYQLKKETLDTSISIAEENLYSLEDARAMRPFEKSYQFQGKMGQYFPHVSGDYEASEMYRRNSRRGYSR